ncbi:hypothetical protein [Aminobacter sp. LjRoot7]
MRKAVLRSGLTTAAVPHDHAAGDDAILAIAFKASGFRPQA